jgi:transcriptional regulator with XRE-family HTH domain
VFWWDQFSEPASRRIQCAPVLRHRFLWVLYPGTRDDRGVTESGALTLFQSLSRLKSHSSKPELDGDIKVMEREKRFTSQTWRSMSALRPESNMTNETSPTANLLAYYIDQSPMTQAEIAQRVGYKRPNVLSMFKTGVSPVPIAKIPILAEVLEIDAIRFLRTALQEYHPELLEVIESVRGHCLTENEMALLERFREELPDEALVIDSGEAERAFDRLACLMGDAPESSGEPDFEEAAAGVSQSGIPHAVPDFAALERPETPFSPGAEIAKILTLRDLGVLSQAEFEHLKAWVLRQAS